MCVGVDCIAGRLRGSASASPMSLSCPMGKNVPACQRECDGNAGAMLLGLAAGKKSEPSIAPLDCHAMRCWQLPSLDMFTASRHSGGGRERGRGCGGGSPNRCGLDLDRGVSPGLITPDRHTRGAIGPGKGMQVEAMGLMPLAPEPSKHSDQQNSQQDGQDSMVKQTPPSSPPGTNWW